MGVKKLASLVLIALMLAVFGTATKASAFEGSGEASVDFLSTYVWRGINLGGNEGVIQPSVGITAGNFGANLWASHNMETDKHVETDLTLSYGREMNGYSYEVGYIHYALDGLPKDTYEAYLSVGVDMALSPTLTYYYDFGLGDGGFAVVSIEHSVGLGGDIALNLGASASMNFDNEVMEADIDGDGKVDDFTDLYNGEITASISIPVTGNITVEPKVAYSVALSSDAEDAMEGKPSLGLPGLSHDGESDVIYGGVGVSISF